MTKKIISLFFTAILIALLIPDFAFAEDKPSIIDNNTNLEIQQNFILVKEISDFKYDYMVVDNNTFLTDYIKETKIDFTNLLEKIKTSKDCIVVGTYKQSFKNNNYLYHDLLDKVSDSIYKNCCKYSSDYNKEYLNTLLLKEFGNELKAGNTCSKTFLFVTQNKKTGAFMSLTPVNIEMNATKNISGKFFKHSTITYSAEIKSLTYLKLLKEVKE
ncbi:hypothetical protein [Anaerosacchariphilus polymeriproducens]|uniref:Uncharacterized protein n=1 Tax=Anaerosacchariphilus polymeriproducens TaxID=1812858 RepID=A0A371AZC9_9FIRM|nr:hypothetical protein [Anaerosacchariphilus polymeriproducens]RDU24958.1 hypothetical protein DWV06_01645 [Anaerosacchariphilus polymeriproducens]